jgi:hypothetical protein
MRETNPIPTSRRWLTEEIVQNEPNFSRPESKCAKRTQFRPAAGGGRRELCKTKPNLGGLGHVGKESCCVRPGRGARDCGVRIADCGLKQAGRGRAPEAKCAKRTQFGPAGSVPVRAWGSMGILRAAGPRAGCACCEETPDGVTTNGDRVQNEPNFAPPQAADGGNCAKRSQTWRDWGMWAKTVVVCGSAGG